MPNSPLHTARSAVFLDRDGVINVKLPKDHYVASSEDFRFLPGAVEALAILKSMGYLLVVVTNQRGIGRNLMTEEDLESVHRFMEEELAKAGVRLDGIYHCPHDEQECCDCRKPKPGMIIRACRDLNIDISRSYMVGDSSCDVAAGKSVGMKTVRIGEAVDENADMVFGSLQEFASHMKRTYRESRSA